MKTRITLLAFAMLLVSVGAARADDDRQVWRDSWGQIVHNSYGTCVRSMWIMDHDPCGTPVQAETVTWKAPAEKRTVVEEAKRTVYFAFNKSDISPEAKQMLNSLSGTLMAADDIESVLIVGYADRIGSVSYNEALSKKRAEHVHDYMVSRGYVKGSDTKTHWVGKSEPTAQCNSKMSRQQLIECLQPDRRVVVEIVYRKQQQVQPPQAPIQSNPQPIPMQPQQQ